MSILFEIPLDIVNEPKPLRKHINQNKNKTDTELELNQVVGQLSALWQAKKFREGIQFGNLHWGAFSKNETFANLLGICYVDNSEFNQALSCFISALKYNPNSHDLLTNTANVFAKQNLFKSAVQYFNKALQIQPKNVATIIGLGTAVRRLHDFETAHKLFKLALEIESASLDALAGLGITHLDLEEYSETIEVFQRYLSHKPDDINIRNNLALTLQTLGRNEEAFDIYKDIVRHSSASPEIFKNYCSSTKILKEDPVISTMEAQLLGSKNKHDRSTLLFCLGKSYNDIQHFETAFKYFEQANKLMHELLPSDKNKILDTSNKVKLFFSRLNRANNINTLKADDNVAPIFIVGMPRSSSTLIEQIISSHPIVYGAGETAFINDKVQPMAWSNENYEDNLQQLKHYYLEKIGPKLGHKTVLVDKSLSNYLYLGFILHAFPNAKIIHSKRDARAVCWSIYKLQFSQQSIKWGYNLDDITEVYDNHISMIEFWNEHFPGKIFNFDYDKLVNNSEDETRKILNFCEMGWDPACLNFYENKRAVRTASTEQVRKKIYSGSQDEVMDYKPYLTKMFKSLDGH